MTYTGQHKMSFLDQLEEAFRPRRRRTAEGMPRATVRPVPSATVSRAAFFRKPEVQAAFENVESSTVDDDTKRELRAVMMMVVSELATMNEAIENLGENVQELKLDVEKLSGRIES